ncbi:MAG: alpha/beta hydrolase [Pseudomonadota bacterium]
MSTSAAAQTAAPPREVYLAPDILTDQNGRMMTLERGLIFVPENRSNPDSRSIPLHFFRAPAKKPEPDRAPVVYLPGGPGYELDTTLPNVFDFIDRMRKTRDVIYVSQRGYPGASGLIPELWLSTPSAALDKPASMSKASAQLARSYKKALSVWNKAGVDMTGYDVLNAVDDVYDIRAALGYEKIALRGCSFGSQWSFSYIKRWPETVDRALLSGVEPLDFAYDSADWLWASMARVAAEAEAQPDFAPHIPEGGLLEVLKAVINRLEKNPVSVDVVHPETNQMVSVRLGADDLRMGAAKNFYAFDKDNDLENLAYWPKFILELYNGDYRMLAMMALSSRSEGNEALIAQTIDNSLGISTARDKRLKAEKARQWVDPNWYFYATRNVAGAPPTVPANFREDTPIDVPVLLVSGDYDWSTPIENAEHAEEFLIDGKLITVGGGTHCPLWNGEQLPAQRPDLTEAIYRFLDMDFENGSAADYLDTLPATINLDRLRYETPATPALYEQLDG